MTADYHALTPPTPITVWHLHLGGAWDDRMVERLLDPTAQARSSRIRSPTTRLEFTRSHAALRLILAQQCSCSPLEIEITRACEYCSDQHGRPRVVWPQTNLHFSVSHSSGFAVIAIARQVQVGADVERILPLSTDLHILLHAFTDAERAAVLDSPEGAQLDAFYMLWTAKEAYAKARGLGLAMETASFEIVGLPDIPTLSPTTDDPNQLWTLHSYIPKLGYIAAIAVAAPISSISQHALDTRQLLKQVGPF